MLITLRSTLYFIAMVGTILVFGLTMSTVGLLLPLEQRDRMGNAWARTNLWLLRRICGLGYRITGAEHLPHRAAIVMAKHQSTWETIALRGLLPPAQSWVLKRELMWLPVFGWALASVPTIAIDRKAGRRAIRTIVEKGTALLQRGRIVIIFPEGTRVNPGERHKYGLGGAILAEQSGFPVIPIAHNAGVFWKRRGLRKHPGTIDVVVGPPIPTQGRKAGDIIREVEAWIEGQVARLPQDP